MLATAGRWLLFPVNRGFGAAKGNHLIYQNPLGVLSEAQMVGAGGSQEASEGSPDQWRGDGPKLRVEPRWEFPSDWVMGERKESRMTPRNSAWATRKMALQLPKMGETRVGTVSGNSGRPF